MRTGLVDNWVNVDQFGAIYPFVGTEGALVVVGVAFWIIWHFIQLKKENAEFKDDIAKIKESGGVNKVLAEEASRENHDIVGR